MSGNGVLPEPTLEYRYDPSDCWVILVSRRWRRRLMEILLWAFASSSNCSCTLRSRQLTSWWRVLGVSLEHIPRCSPWRRNGKYACIFPCSTSWHCTRLKGWIDPDSPQWQRHPPRSFPAAIRCRSNTRWSIVLAWVSLGLQGYKMGSRNRCCKRWHSRLGRQLRATPYRPGHLWQLRRL